MELKEHLTPEGLQKIVNLRTSLNLGLSEDLKIAFPNTILVPRPLVQEKIFIPHSQWLAGFATGEGMFSVGLHKGKFKYLLFKLTQHIRDEQLMRSIEEYLNCGYCYLRKGENLIPEGFL